MKKWFLRLTIAVTCLIVLLLGAGYFLLGTQSGTDFLVSQAQQQLDGSLQIGSARGTVLDRLEVQDISFTTPQNKTEIGSLLLDWKSTDLLHRNFHILQLAVDKVSLNILSQTPPEEQPEKSEPLVLPELQLPITIAVDQLNITDVTFVAAPGAEPVVVDRAGLGLVWDKNGIRLRDLQISMPEGSFEGEGTIRPEGSYPLELSTTLTAKDPDLPALKLAGSFRGDLEKLTIDQQLSGDVKAELAVTLQNLLADISWQGNINIQQLIAADFSPDAPGTLQGKLTTSGNLHKAVLTGSLSMRDKAPELNWDGDIDLNADLDTLQATINTLQLNHPDLPTRVSLSGTASADQLDLSLNWQDLQWPLEQAEDAALQYGSNQGTVQLTGSPEAWHLTLDTEVSGTESPKATIALTTDGSMTAAENIQLTAELLEGTIGMQGRVQWSPTVQWQLTTTGTDINPGLQYADWPGKFSWKIDTNGSLEEKGVSAEVVLEKIAGTLRDYPLAGSGSILVKPENILINNLQLSSGSAGLEADGELSADSSLKWQAKVPDLGELLPGAEGDFSASGKVVGKMKAPLAEVSLAASSLAWQETSLEKLEADASVDLSWNEPFAVKITGTDLHSGENLITDVALTADGTMEKHTAKLSLNHQLAELNLQLQGGYQQEQQLWQGTLEQLTLASQDLGTWKLDKSSDISAGSKAASLTPLCLVQQKSKICADGAWDKDNTTTGGKVEVSDFPLSALSAWFPEALTELSGMFSLKATATMHDTLQADVQADVTPGSIGYKTLQNTGTIPHQGVKLNLKVADTAVKGDLQLGVDSNIVNARFNSPDLLAPEIGDKAQIDGDLRIKARKFDLVQALVPALEELQLGVNTDFKISGTLGSPRITGDGALNLGRILIPDAGVDLADTVFDIKAAGNRMQLSGTLHSPEGSLALNGGVELDGANGWPASFTVKGDNFRLVDLPEIQIFLSSDLKLEKTKELMRVSGNVTIPKADILLRELPPGSASVSPDVTILQETEQEEEPSPVEMAIKLRLGNKVHFAGMGVNAFIEGALSITAEPGEQMMGSGEFHIKEGSFRAYGQDLEILTGSISFPGGPLLQPGINLKAVRQIGDIVVGVYAIGPVAKPRITTMSDPPMSESSIISYLITGSSANDPGSGAKLSVGRQINSKLSVSVGADVKTGESEFITRYRLNRKIHVETTTGGESNAADVFYTIEVGDKGEKQAPEEGE